MSKITYCVRPRGEGKTQWLIEQVANEVENERNIWYAGTPESFKEFCEIYLSLVGKVCPVQFLEIAEDIEVDDVVVIDNGMSYSNIGEVVANLYPLVYKLYITLEGDLERKTMKNKLTEQDEFIQLTIDDNREEVTK